MERTIRIQKNRENGNNSDRSEFSEIFNSPLVKLLLLGISTFIIISVYNSAKITFQKLEILKQAQREVEELRIQNLYLSLSITEMSTDRYLEKEARDRLNFGDNGDIVFVIPENALEQAKIQVAEITTDREIIELKSGINITNWVDFLKSGI